ncbi:hypothetical protein SNE40_004889 [Patella caerulea]|uniref:Uncharacterized protein n=1 Tax=Patella caerulea TaxID=87958 RepID=A0AAN8KAA7_PATCE
MANSLDLKPDGNGMIHIPTNCDLLNKLYGNQGVRIRMLQRHPLKQKKNPTVRQLIDELAKKHDKLLEEKEKQQELLAALRR